LKKYDPEVYKVFVEQNIRRAVVSVLSFHGKPFGFFVLENPNDDAFADRDLLMPGLRYVLSSMVYSEHLVRKLMNIGYKDALTGLPNRTHFMIYARDILHKSLRKRRYGAVMFVDVDKFKFVNDTFGHAVGDGLLIGFGRRLVEIIGNKKQVCRFGGDEFVLFLPEAAQETVAELAEAIVNKMREPFRISGSEFVISASIGIAHYPTDATTIDELLQLADTALYVSKRNGRNQFNIYNKDMTVEQDD
jgi:diguanylate cyclase (GGDEF)-like protein